MYKLSDDIVNSFIEPCIQIFEQVSPGAGTLSIGDMYFEINKISA